ncbi:hypothetical protein FIBSPDRAFT_892493 [Athelia psychrophila]|uniref:Uncharacterized protein n=1 Tax=Athelia psychrophila TaxID=1759441 RepID=A0A166IEB3_9AGAM|nr:hypothetical protein FIBSPDRAFT_892493 [Fibularhizoctonia sp. CBS 109695]
MPGKPHPQNQEPHRRFSTDGHTAHPESYDNTLPQLLSTPSDARLQDCRPRIWCSNLKELSDTLPALKHLTNGISWQRSDIPYLVLDGLPWRKPQWYNGTEFVISMSYDFPSNVENVPFQSNHSGMPKYYHHTTGSLGGPWTEHAHPWRKSIPDLDFDFIESEAFYQDLTGMGLSSFSTNRDRSSPGAVKGEAIQLTSIPSKRIAPHQSINNPTSSRDLKFLGGFEDAHKSGKPIAIIASPECLFDPIQLPSEYAYSFLGLFFLVDIHANLKDVVYPSDATQSGHRRIKHDLHFCWTPGGEDLLPNGNMLTAPWWVPLMSKGSEAFKGGAPATVKATAVMIYSQWTSLENWGRYHWVLALPTGGTAPLAVGSMNRYISDIASALLISGPQIGYAEPLKTAREHPQSLPLLGPGDRVPKCYVSDPPFLNWDDGMRTYCYTLGNDASMKHVFSYNTPSLQVGADTLFLEIQSKVQLSVGPTNFFSCPAIGGRLESAAAVPWEQAPQCLSQARELMVLQARAYCESEDCSLDKLDTLAWIKSGVGKGPAFHARDGFIIIMCLGADAVLTLDVGSDITKCDTEPTPDGKEIVLNNASIHAPLVHLPPSQGTVAGTAHIKAVREPLVVTLIHGDVLLVANCDLQARTLLLIYLNHSLK